MCNKCEPQTHEDQARGYYIAPCGQNWLKEDGHWRAVTRHVVARFREKRQQETIGFQVMPTGDVPRWVIDNDGLIKSNPLREAKTTDPLKEFERKNYCPWMADWPEGWPWMMLWHPYKDSATLAWYPVHKMITGTHCALKEIVAYEISGVVLEEFKNSSPKMVRNYMTDREFTKFFANWNENASEETPF